MKFYIANHLIYPNHVVTEDYLKGVPGHMIYNKKQHADVTFESEFENLTEPQTKLVKMMKKQYIDSFFETGKLQLGTFDYYRSIDHTEQGDKTEGSVILVGQNSNLTSFTEITGGFNNYLFCCYDGNPNKEIINRFGYDDYFIIDDPQEFMDAISNKLEVVNKIRSKCIYKKDKVLIGKTPDNFNYNVISAELTNVVAKTKHFIKLENYKLQNEYRFMWELNHDVVEPLVIECPEAVKYCSRK